MIFVCRLDRVELLDMWRNVFSHSMRIQRSCAQSATWSCCKQHQLTDLWHSSLPLSYDLLVFTFLCLWNALWAASWDEDRICCTVFQSCQCLISLLMVDSGAVYEYLLGSRSHNGATTFCSTQVKYSQIFSSLVIFYKAEELKEMITGYPFAAQLRLEKENKLERSSHEYRVFEARIRLLCALRSGVLLSFHFFYVSSLSG